MNAKKTIKKTMDKLADYARIISYTVAGNSEERKTRWRNCISKLANIMLPVAAIAAVVSFIFLQEVSLGYIDTGFAIGDSTCVFVGYIMLGSTALTLVLLATKKLIERHLINKMVHQVKVEAVYWFNDHDVITMKRNKGRTWFSGPQNEKFVENLEACWKNICSGTGRHMPIYYNGEMIWS